MAVVSLYPRSVPCVVKTLFRHESMRCHGANKKKWGEMVWRTDIYSEAYSSVFSLKSPQRLRALSILNLVGLSEL